MKKILVFLFVVCSVAAHSQTSRIIKAGGVNPFIWGRGTGNLSDQTDLQAALNNKYDASNPGNFLQYSQLPNLYDKNGTHARNDSTRVWGGTLDSITSIDGTNTYPLTFTGFQSGSGRGFRVNFGSDAQGDMWYRDANGFWNRLPIGGAQQHLLGGTIPHWVDTAVAGGGGGSGNPNTKVGAGFWLVDGSTNHVKTLTASGATWDSVTTNVLNLTVSDATINTTDITTNNASTSKHGFLKKLDNTATHYMDGTGNWSTPAGGAGDVQIIAETTVTNQANFIIDLSSYYNVYNHIRIRIWTLNPATNSTDLQMLTSADAAAYDNTSTNYVWSIDGNFSSNGTSNGSSSIASSVSGSSTAIIELANSIGNQATSNNRFTLECDYLSNASLNPSFYGQGTYLTSSGGIASRLLSGQRVNAQVTKALKFQMSAGNISCKYAVWGYN